MRKLVLTLAATAAMTSVAHADGYWPRHNGGYQHREYHNNCYNCYRGGGDNGGALIGGLIGGMILGGMLNQAEQPRYYEPAPRYYQPQQVCHRVFVGNVVVDGEWVQAYQNVCN